MAKSKFIKELEKLLPSGKVGAKVKAKAQKKRKEFEQKKANARKRKEKIEKLFF